MVTSKNWRSGSSHPPKGLEQWLIQKEQVKDVAGFFCFCFLSFVNFHCCSHKCFLLNISSTVLREAGSCEGEFCCVSCRWDAEMLCAGASRLPEDTFSHAPAGTGLLLASCLWASPSGLGCLFLHLLGRDYACWANVWEVFWSSLEEKERLPHCDTPC